MNFKEIEELLRKYYEGNTTPDEERRMTEFFLSDEVPPHLAVEADLFRGMAGNRSEEIPDPEFEDKLLQRINDTPVIPMSTIRNRYYSIIGIAAGILLLAGIFLTFRNDFILNSAKHPSKEVVASYEQTREVLMMVSANLNVGLDKVAYISKFSDGIENAEKLSAFYKYQSIIINPDEFNNPQKHK